MIFVFIEDGTLEIIEDISEAQNNYEAFDVECEVYHFYNESGIYMKPIFTKPNKVNNYLLFKTIKSGEFTLVPDPNNTIEDPISVALSEVVAVEKNKWFNSVEEIERFLTNR